MPLIMPMLRKLAQSRREHVQVSGALSDPNSGQQFLFPGPTIDEVGVLAPEPQAPFYLKTERIFSGSETKAQEGWTGGQYLDWLKNQKYWKKNPEQRANATELKYTGLEDWLPRQGPTTKAKILKFIQENPNRPELNRLTLGDPKTVPRSTTPGALDPDEILRNPFSPELEYLKKSREAEDAGQMLDARTYGILAEEERLLGVEDRSSLMGNARDARTYGILAEEERLLGVEDRSSLMGNARDSRSKYLRHQAEGLLEQDNLYEGRGQDRLAAQIRQESYAQSNAANQITTELVDPRPPVPRSREEAVSAGWAAMLDSDDVRIDVRMGMDSDGDITVDITDSADDSQIHSQYYDSLSGIADEFGQDSEIYDMAKRFIAQRDEAPVYISERNMVRHSVLDEDGDTVWDSDWVNSEDDYEDVAGQAQQYLDDNDPLDADGDATYELNTENETHYEVYDESSIEETFDNIEDARHRQKELQNEYMIDGETEYLGISEGGLDIVDDYVAENYGGGLESTINPNAPEPDKWEQYSEAGGDHYSEDVLMYPGVDYHNATHWGAVTGAKNEVGHTRQRIKYTPAGESVTFGEEGQADLAQAATKEFGKILNKKMEERGRRMLLGDKTIQDIRNESVTARSMAKGDVEGAKRVEDIIAAEYALQGGNYTAPQLQKIRQTIAADLKKSGVSGYGIAPEASDFVLEDLNNWEFRHNPETDDISKSWEAVYSPLGEVAFQGSSLPELQARQRQLVNDESAYNQVQDVLEGALGAIDAGLPDTPFKGDMARLLGFKNHLARAAEDGTEFVALTPAWMQHRRYLGPNNRRAGAAEKLTAEQARKIGYPEGAPHPGDQRVPYDQVLPNMLNRKYLKQLGRETGERYQLEPIQVNMDYNADGVPGTEEVLALRLTPKLREHVLGDPNNPMVGGQSLFSAGGATAGIVGAMQPQSPQQEPTGSLAPDSPYERTKAAVSDFASQYGSENIAPPGQRALVAGGMNDLVQLAAGLENALALGAQGATGVMGALEILGSVLTGRDQDTEEVLNRWQGYSYRPRSTQAKRQQAILLDLIRDNPKLRDTLQYLGEIGPETEQSILNTTGSKPLSQAGRAVLEMM